MTAREMFEKLGYTRNLDSKKIIYAKELKGMFRYVEITFNLTEKEVELYDDYEAYTINKALLKAIQQQLKELHWLEEKVEIKEAINPEVTNLEYYKDEILENCIENLAVVKGRPKLCYKINCNDCDFKLVQKGCHNKVKDWLKQTHIKPTYKLTKFEKDLLQCYSSGHKFGLFNSLIGMKEKGYFKCIDENEEIDYILANCEVVG